MPETYRLMVQLCCPGEYQLLLRLNEPNQTMLIYTTTTYALCKTAATAIFALTFTWDDTIMQTADVASLKP